MNVIATFPDLAGFYVLTPDGQLGFHDQNNKFVLDAKLNKTFAEYTKQYLMTYLRNPDQGNFRLAIIHLTQEKRPWGSCTLLLEKQNVRKFYPVTGMTTELDLTTFQKKNREKSIYRGMELFLEYKDSSIPDMPVYCPVLYDRGKTLGDYASVLDRPVSESERDTPVVEVINLLAGIPVARRFSPEVAILKEKIYKSIVKKGMRKSEEFTLIEDVRRNAQNADTEQVSDDPYGDFDKRAERRVTMNPPAGGDKSSAFGSHDNALINNICGSLVGRPEPADTMMLKTFYKLRDLDHDKLAVLAARCLVYKVPPGTQLLERGTKDTWNLYLLEGAMQLIAADGVEKFIEGGTDTARNPISFLKPRMYTVVAFTRVAFLWIDDKLIEEVMQGKAQPARRDGTA